MDTTREPLSLDLHETLTAMHGAHLVNAEPPLLAGQSRSRYQSMVFDSRKAEPGSILLCIKGARSDAHDHAGDAIRLGATLIIGTDADKIGALAAAHPSVQFLVVKDALVALTQLATYYRRKFDVPVLGLTGSSGKTTTKDLLASIFAATGREALVTEGTLNNHWGVPQMVMRWRPSHKVAAFEMGTSGFGEIQALAAICQPGIGHITTIGSSHLETLGDEDGVLRAKRELFDWIVEHGTNRALVFNLDNPRLRRLHEEFSRRPNGSVRLLTLSMDDDAADVKVESRQALGMEHRYGWEFRLRTPWGPIDARLPLPGAHNLFNALSSTALALLSGAAGPAEVTAGLARASVSKLRSNIFRAPAGAVVYDDSYNSNPTSVAALFEAARVIRESPQARISRVVAAVGDMLELGPTTRDLHREMGRRAAIDGIDVLLATGQFASDWVAGFRDAKAASGSPDACGFGSQAELFDALKHALRDQPTATLVLVKGSRGAKMDQIVEQLKSLSI